MDDLARLAFIAVRFRELQAPDDATALRSIEELTAGAARVISRHWVALSPRLGWSSEGPFPVPDSKRNAATDNQLWAMGFQFIADSVWRRIAGSEIPIGFKSGSFGAFDGGRFDDFTQDVADWRNTALRYAAVLDEVAKYMTKRAEPAAVIPQEPAAVKPDVLTAPAAAEPDVPATTKDGGGKPGRKQKRKPVKSRKAPGEFNTLIEATFEAFEANSRDKKVSGLVEFLLTSTADEISEHPNFKCNRKTVLGSKWWKLDRTKQQERFFGNTVGSPVSEE